MTSNTFITPDVVAKQGLASLRNHLVMGNLVHKAYSPEFRKVGDTVSIRKPAEFTAIEFDGDLTGEYKAITETSTTIKMDKTFVVPVEVTAHEMTLDVNDFYTQVAEPAGAALAQYIDSELTRLYRNIPYQVTSGGTIADVISCRKELNDNKAPFTGKRSAVLSPTTTAMMLALDTFAEVDKVGRTQALYEASLGRLFGFDFYETQNIQTHAVGTVDLAGAVSTTAAAGATSVIVKSLGTGTVNEGTKVTFADDGGVYVVTEDATISANAATLKIYPALEDGTAGDQVVTLEPALTTSSENLFFHENAFAMVTAPLAPPMGGATGASMNFDNLSINVTYDYDSATMKNIIQFSVLCGFKTLYPEYACRLYDAS